MSAHTPGPWSLHPRYVLQVIGADNFAVANCSVVSQNFDLDKLNATQEANAALITAAPDMLAALKAILAADERGQGLPFQEAMGAAIAAIAKATP